MSKKRTTIPNRLVGMLLGDQIPGPENLLFEIRCIVEQIYTMSKRHLPGNEPFFVIFAIVQEEGWTKELFDVKATWNSIKYSTLNKNGVLFAYEVDNELVEHDVDFDYPMARFMFEALKYKFHQSPCDCLEPKNESAKAVHLTPHGPRGLQFPFAE